MKKNLLPLTALAILSLGFAFSQLDKALREVIRSEKLEPLRKTENLDSAKVQLGRLLFFDKILSGNKDISCATCHHPALQSGDSLALSIGVGGQGLGQFRQMGENRLRIPRNSPEIFNRGIEGWHTLFWDGRVAQTGKHRFDTPAEEKLPGGLDDVLAAQAMFPVLARDEMRGRIGDRDASGTVNELALISNAAPQSVWRALMVRILEYEEYRELFAAVYPGVPLEQLGFQHAANAIAAFEREAFNFVDSPWDRYLAGENQAISEPAKRGALLFYGAANCASCHRGNLMTDQQFHNLGVPQFGPGKDSGRPYDFGRYAETGRPEDRFAFRTPPLRNVALTGPWMHNGAYSSLDMVIRHHLNPEIYLRQYNPDQLEASLQASYHGDARTHDLILETLDSGLGNVSLTDNEITDLVHFLESLTDASARQLNRLVPARVPSGLPVDRSRARSVGY